MASAVGFSFSYHYCAGHYKGICFSSDTEKDCCGENEHETNCCKDKIVKAKIKDDQSHSLKAILGKIIFKAGLSQYPTVSISCAVHCEEYTSSVANDSSPPTIGSVPIYLMNRVLRI